MLGKNPMAHQHVSFRTVTVGPPNFFMLVVEIMLFFMCAMAGTSTSSSGKRARRTTVRMADDEDEDHIEFENEEDTMQAKKHRLETVDAGQFGHSTFSAPLPVSLCWPWSVFVLVLPFAFNS
jgi:hypothetical protein